MLKYTLLFSEQLRVKGRNVPEPCPWSSLEEGKH